MKKIFAILSFMVLTVAMAWAQRPIGNRAPQDLTLQETSVWPEAGHVFCPGDTVVINRGAINYITGQEMSRWVYNVPHLVGQVDGKRYPNCILIGNITSWVDPAWLKLLSNPAPKKAAAGAEAKVETKIETRVDTIYRVDTVILGNGEVGRDTVLRLDTLFRVDTLLRVDTIYVRDTVYMGAQRSSIPGNAQRLHRFSVGLHGGPSSLMQRTDGDVLGRGKVGFNVLADLEYAFYAPVGAQRKVWLGIKTGLSVGYTRSSMSSSVDLTYSDVQDADVVTPQQVDYHVASSKLNEANGQVQLEIPVHFALKHECGFFLNAGPRFSMPVYSHYDMSASKSSMVEVRYPDLGYSVWNEEVTGAFTRNNRTSKGRFGNANIHVMLNVETGYEFTLKNFDAIGLGVYANYSVWDNYKKADGDTPLLEIGKPQAGGAELDLHSAMDAMGKNLGYWDAGVKVVYHFNFWR